ncbi:N-formylglutamate deformylase [Lysobacter humi (ex Lee et al. 2017)]
MSDDARTETYTLHRGRAPLIVSLPHDGSEIPGELAARMADCARGAPDTDWHVSRLYAFARDELGASMLVPRFSRYVVDLNRPPDDASLYPGQNTTGLCPVTCFSGEPIYREGEAPDAAEIAARRERYWRPYHAALEAEIARLVDVHGRAVLWEGHSIRGDGLPFLFEGRLPDLNLGTAGGASCAPATQSRMETVLGGQDAYDWVVNGRFKGGYITRHYGRPERGVEAIQLETSQRAYMDEATTQFDPARAAALEPLLERLMRAALGEAAPGR